MKQRKPTRADYVALHFPATVTHNGTTYELDAACLGTHAATMRPVAKYWAGTFCLWAFCDGTVCEEGAS